MAFASLMAREPVLSPSCDIGAPASDGANEIVDRPVLSFTETKIRSGRSLSRIEFDVPDI